MKIVGLRVPNEANRQLQNVVVFKLVGEPPEFPEPDATGGEVFSAIGRPSGAIISTDLEFAAGDYIGILGAAGDATSMYNSYGPGPTFASNILGEPVTLTRFLSQDNIASLDWNGKYRSDTAETGRFGRVEVYVEPLTPPNSPPVANAGSDVSGDEGSPIVLDGSGSTDPDGDTLSYAWTYTPVSDVDTGASCSFDPVAGDTASVSITCTDDGVYEATLTVRDGTNDPVSDSAAVSVQNVAPSVGTITPSTTAPVAVNTSVSISAAYTDPGSNDTHTASINWGDGSTESGAANGGTASGSHTYTAAGVYAVELTVADDDGGSGSASYQYIVVYDPAAGFVTGGGWIDSPAGAYTEDPSLSGKANFGFVSRYQRGKSVPGGQTQFQFHAAGFSFHSTAYEWLVISGPKAQYKGAGTVNGSGEYGFMLTANDGQVNGGGGVDTFRLKVWDVATEEVVYDNQFGDADDSSATAAIEGGSIVIHNAR